MKSNHPILIGCSGWSYPDWEGPFYPAGMDSGDYLSYYAGRFPIVEVDSSFYRPPTAGMVKSWRERTPADFRFILKVPRVITHDKQLRDCGEELDGFLSSIMPLGEKLAGALLQLGYFNQGAFKSLADFLDVLDPFLEAWPIESVPLAVEVRNPRWVVKDLMTVLRAHGAGFTLTEQKWMPSSASIIERIDPITGPLSIVRLLGDREAIEKQTQTWDRLVVDRSEELDRLAPILERLADRVPTYVFLNNHYAGHSPGTARMLRVRLGQPEPDPEPRRYTLFD